MGKVRRKPPAVETPVVVTTTEEEDRYKRAAVTNAVIIGLVDRHFHDSILAREHTVGHYANAMDVYHEAYKVANVILSDPVPTAHGAGIRAVRDYLKNAPVSASAVVVATPAPAVVSTHHDKKEDCECVTCKKKKKKHDGKNLKDDDLAVVQPITSLDDIMSRMSMINTRRNFPKG